MGRFWGDVPESKVGLMDVTGIGDKLAGLLAKVNTKERGRAYMEGLKMGEGEVEGLGGEEASTNEVHAPPSNSSSSAPSPIMSSYVVPSASSVVPSRSHMPLSSEWPICGGSFLTRLLQRHAELCKGVGEGGTKKVPDEGRGGNNEGGGKETPIEL